MKRKSYCILLILTILVSCTSKQNVKGEIPEIVVDLENKSGIQPFAFKDFSFVALEVSNESMLRDIAKVICHKNRIYVLSTAEPTVFIFDDTGKYERKLSKGQGPGEVVFVSDLEIYNDTLCVLDSYRKIKMYSLAGEYIEDKQMLEQPFFSFFHTSDGVYLFDPNINKKSDYNLHFLSNKGTQGTFLPKNKWFRNVSVLTYNFVRDGFVVWPLSDTIYKISDNGDVESAFHIDFKGKWIELQEYKSAVENKDMYSGRLNKYARWLKDFILMEDGCFFGFKYDKDYFVKWQKGKATLYSNLLDGMPEMREAAVGTAKNALIYVYVMNDLKEYAEKHSIPDNPELKQLYKMAEDENANPILIFVPINQK